MSGGICLGWECLQLQTLQSESAGGISVSVVARFVVAMASGKVMDPETLNENVKKTVYAVRGELYLRASELQKEGKKVGNFTTAWE